MLERRHLETLSAIRQHGSLVEAAEHLHVTQSALSHQLKELEGRLGLQLLHRRTRPLRFTNPGLKVLELADQVLPQLQALERELRRMAAGESGRMHVAIECHSCFQWLMPALDRFRGLWPGVTLDLSAAFSFAPLPALVRGDLDLVITSDPDTTEAVQWTPLFRYELVLAVANDHPLARRRNVAPEDLAGVTLITYPVERDRLDVFTAFLDPAGVTPSAVRTAELTPMMIQLAASGRGVVALPNWALTEYLEPGLVTAVSLGEAGVWRTLYAGVRSEDADSPYLQDFIGLAREHCFRSLAGIRAPE